MFMLESITSLAVATEETVENSRHADCGRDLLELS